MPDKKEFLKTGLHVNGVEIFSTGTWNGDEYTLEDLQEMVSAFEDTKVGIKPYLKLGHDEEQKLLQNDGLPAAGWIDCLYIKGEKLYANFTDIPKKIWELIQSKAYRKVSCEIYWNIKIGEKIYPKLLSAVALLGADTPGVMNLSDILAMYKAKYTNINLEEKPELEVDSAITTRKEKAMPEKSEQEIKLEYDLKQKEGQLEALETEKKDYAAKADGLQKEVEELKKFKAQAEADKAKAEAEVQKAKTEQFVSGLVSDKLCSPAMKPYIVELLGESKKEYSFGDKKLSKEETLKETLKLFKAACDVNFDESSEQGEEGTKKNNEEKLDKAAKEYAEKNKVSYAVALKAVIAEQKGS